MSEIEIMNAIKELRNLQALIDEAQQEAEALKDQIKATMGDREEIRAGEYKVTWKTIESSRLDSSALKKDLPDIAAKYTKTTKTRRFCVA